MIKKFYLDMTQRGKRYFLSFKKKFPLLLMFFNQNFAPENT